MSADTNQDSQTKAFEKLFLEINALKDCIECYMVLYNSEKTDFDAIVKFQSDFFSYLQWLLINDIAVRIVRLLDKRTDVLSLEYFARAHIDETSLDELLDKLNDIRDYSKPIMSIRHKLVAHKDLAIAMEENSVEPIKLSVAKEVAEMMKGYLSKLADRAFPDGILDSNGSRVVYFESEYRKLATKDLVRKTKRYNEKLSFTNFL